MQTTRIINEHNIGEVLVSVYKEGNPVAYQADSEYGEDLKVFNSKEELAKEIKRLIQEKKPFLQFALHYPDSDGYVEKQRINLDPRVCKGHTFRFSARGWGLIYLQFDTKKNEGIECRVAVNTEKRANSWKDTYPSLKDPAMWNWKVVARNARRIIRVINKVAQQIAPADAPKDCAADH